MIDKRKMNAGVFLIFLNLVLQDANAMIDGLYCGVHDCYKVLDVDRLASRSEISKAYRQLAKKYHPDTQKSKEDKETAAEQFMIIANAYEILRDDGSRADYDYMLDHPEEVYSHYYRYYKRRMTPKVDVRIVIIVCLMVISVIQYYVAWQRYESAIKYLMTVPKYRNQALEIARTTGLLNNSNGNNNGQRRSRNKSKTEAKEELDSIIRGVLENNLDIRGGYAKPKISDIIIFQIALFPYNIYSYLQWYLTWLWKYDIRKNEYGDEEKLYLIRKNMKLGVTQFEQYTEEEKQEFLKQELWKDENFKRWKEKKDDEARKHLAENARYKAYRRYIKNHGPGRITFDDS